MKIKVGDIAAITFLDHAENYSVPIRCIVYGRVKKMSRRAIVVCSWDFAGKPPPNSDPESVEIFTVVRSAIENIDRLVKARGT